jgi:GDP-4-dehydro-6-deoxy-D-mannose reductase
MAAIADFQPDAVAHLAAVSHAADVADDPGRALEIAVGGVFSVIAALTAARAAGRPDPVLLVTGSSEVYGVPGPGDLPLVETSVPRPETPYAFTKAAQEGVALAAGPQHGIRVIVTRSFNHTGPGQKPSFVIPAFAHRILAAAASGGREVPVGNLEVRRDLSDVRDVATAYRQLLELGAAGETPREGIIVNVASGRSVELREVFGRLASLAGVAVTPVTDAALIRRRDAPEIRADLSRLQELTGWRPAIDLDTTLSDVLQAIREDGIAAS